MRVIRSETLPPEGPVLPWSSHPPSFFYLQQLRVDLSVSVCFLSQACSHERTQRLLSSAGSPKASLCWNRVPLYVWNVCQTRSHTHTHTGRSIDTHTRPNGAGPAHAGVNQHAGPSQRIIHWVSSSLQQVSPAATRQKCPQNRGKKEGCFRISLFTTTEGGTVCWLFVC